MTACTYKPQSDLRLDPWVASSLLQKAIRRSETDWALKALEELRRHRGAAVWRRLMNIAIEDVGIANLGLVLEASALALKPELRGGAFPEDVRMRSLVEALCEAPKDRSVDYAYCGATRLETALSERAGLQELPAADLMEIAGDCHAAIFRRANAAMIACTKKRARGDVLDEEAVHKLLDVLDSPRELRLTLGLHARHRLSPFSLMLPLLWSHMQFVGGTGFTFVWKLPEVGCAGGVPLYTFDKHTAVGKRAVARLLDSCPELTSLLLKGVERERWNAVTGMAAFYADAVTLKRRYDWHFSDLLEELGTFADMTWAGCPHEMVLNVLDCVSRNAGALDAIRAAEAERAT